MRRSPRGGSPLSEMLNEESLRVAQPNVLLVRNPEEKVINNYYCITLGYVDRDLKKGDKIYIRPNELVIWKKIIDGVFPKRFSIL